MKTKITLILFIVLSISIKTAAQAIINLSSNKLTQLVFFSKIVSYKVSVPNSVAIMVEDNTLYIQPTSHFPNANMTVTTEDKKYYAFNINYDIATKYHYLVKPETAMFNLSHDTLPIDPQPSTLNLTQPEQRILEKKGYLYNYNAIALKKLSLSIKGVYIDSKYIYFRLELQNRSNIDYNVEYVAFYTNTKNKNRKRVTQQVQKIPLSSYPISDLKLISGKSTMENIYKFPLFTLSKNKQLFIDFVEINGERTLSLPISANFILNAQPF